MCEVDCFNVTMTRMHGFMKKGTFADVTFVIQGRLEKKHAHKIVLAGCSPVFEAMFQSYLIEGSSNVVEINDVDQQAFSVFLDYVYLRDAKLVKNHVNQLLMLADKYNVETLALVCDGYIEASLTAENAVDSLILADLFRRYDLRAKIGHFIKSNLEIISMYPSWAKLGDDFELMTALLHSFIQEEGAKLCWKLPNSVTWNIRNEGDWCDDIEITPSKKLTFSIKLTFSNNKIAVRICVINRLGRQVSSVLLIRNRSISGVEAQTNIRSSWSPGTHSGPLILVPGEEDCRYIYPMFLTVVVKMSDPSDEFQTIDKIVERNSRFSDAEIFTEDGGKFPVHKLVLSNYSEFFSKLFKDDQKLYTILGVDRKTIILLLDYIYSRSNLGPEIVDLNLLKGAKQFQLDRLVEYCVSILEDNIRHDNVVEICTTAEELGLERLVSAAMDFMRDKTGEIMKSAKWSTMKLHPKLIKQLLFKVKENSSENQ